MIDKSNRFSEQNPSKNFSLVTQESNDANFPRVFINVLFLYAIMQKPEEINFSEIQTTPNYELAEECLKTNYYGPKSVTAALLPFLQLSDSPRIINVSSAGAKLMV